MPLAPALSPHGRLSLQEADEAAGLTSALAPELASRLTRAFARGSGHGLLTLGVDEIGTCLLYTSDAADE